MGKMQTNMLLQNVLYILAIYTYTAMLIYNVALEQRSSLQLYCVSKWHCLTCVQQALSFKFMGIGQIDTSQKLKIKFLYWWKPYPNGMFHLDFMYLYRISKCYITL